MRRRRSVSALITFFTLCLIPSTVWSQANVNESLETASLYVDGTHGSDSNPGTPLQPLATISQAASLAMNNNEQNVGTRVIINPGTYREAIAINKMYKSTSLPITFQASKTGTVIVSGADVWTGWSQSGNFYTHAWPYHWGTCAPIPAPAPLQQEIVLRQEMIFINGTPLTQVLSKTAMQPGTFFADESNSTVYVWPASGTDMATATVEVATQPALFTDQEQANVVLRGLSFQHANTCRDYAAVNFSGTTNVLVDTDSFNWNNASGLWFSGSSQNFTVQNSVANHNGQKGFASHQVKYGLWQSDTANYNNWRGAQGALYTYDAGGFRLFLDHHSTFNNVVALFNQTQGVHFDTDNENMTISAPLLANNLYGFLLEASQGPITVSNGYFCSNNMVNQVNVGGFDFRNSSYATLTGNVYYGNLVNQITINGIESGIAVTNWETGQTYNLFTDHVTLSKNTIATNSNTSRTFYDANLASTSWTDFVTTLSSGNNVWSAGGNTTPFIVPAPKMKSRISFPTWQSLTLQDKDSSYETSVDEPSQCNVSPDGPDFWLLSNYLNGVTVSGGQAQFTVSTVSVGGLTGTINLSVDGVSAISGATASFSPSSITIGGYTVLTVSTKSTTPKGTYPVTVIANSGNLTRTVTVSLVVP
jgi:Right handed beta helix region